MFQESFPSSFQYPTTCSRCSATPTAGSASLPATLLLPAACHTPPPSRRRHHRHYKRSLRPRQPASTRSEAPPPTRAAAKTSTVASEAAASVRQPLTTEVTTLTRSSLSRPLSSWRRRPENRRSDPTGFRSSASLERERPLTSGSSCSSCCRTRRAVLASSSGRTGRREFSSWSTRRQSPGSGACTRTSRTWTTKPWAELSGKKKYSNKFHKST